MEPVGARKPVKVDVRLISATNRDLIADVKEGRFREDLYYRIAVFPLAVPALRERREDIPELARHFLARFAAEEGKRTARISSEAVSLLSAHRWPGNVRQLENAVFRAVVLADGETVGSSDFPQIAAQIGDPVNAPVAPELFAPEGDCEQSLAAASPPLVALVDAAPVIPPGGAPMTGQMALLDANGHVRPLDEMEADTIRFAITHYRGQMSEVARRLRIGRSTLYRKLDSLGLAAHIPAEETPAL